MLGGASAPLAADAELQRWNGAAPPAFTLPDSNGANLTLASARGQVVLLHFFATWCEHCATELPALSRLAERSNGKVKVLAISVAESDRRVRRFFEKMPVNFPVLLDRDRATTKAWSVSTLPTTIVLDENLRPKLVADAELAWDSFDAAKLSEMLANIPDKITDKPAKTEIPEKPTHRGG
jgi:peroxiredoxin